jgi:PTS system glucose-specific IIA component
VMDSAADSFATPSVGSSVTAGEPLFTL